MPYSWRNSSTNLSSYRSPTADGTAAQTSPLTGALQLMEQQHKSLLLQKPAVILPSSMPSDWNCHNYGPTDLPQILSQISPASQ
jgi:hypothetical protein